jgi:hypothetical protein
MTLRLILSGSKKSAFHLSIFNEEVKGSYILTISIDLGYLIQDSVIVNFHKSHYSMLGIINPLRIGYKRMPKTS